MCEHVNQSLWVRLINIDPAFARGKHEIMLTSHIRLYRFLREDVMLANTTNLYVSFVYM